MTRQPGPSRPTDEEIRALLSELPRPEPPPGFADAVMARVHRERHRRRWIPRIAWWAAAAATLAIFASALLLAPDDREGAPPPVADAGSTQEREALAPSAERAEFEALRADYRRLAEDMELLRRFAGESAGSAGGGGLPGPLVRIGGSDQLDLFLDLGSFLELPPVSASSRPVVVPASDRR